MYSRSWWITFLLLCPQFVQADSPKPTDRWKNLAKGGRSIIGDTPVNIPNLLPTLAPNGVKAGAADLNYSADGKSLVIDQKSARLLGYWTDYNIGEGHAVRYNQPTDSVAVNIIQQQSPSLILGSLECSASCWLVNPNGVFFGENSRVNTRGLIAAAMELNGVPMDAESLTEQQISRFNAGSLFDGINDSQPFLVNAKDFIEDASDLPRISVEQETTADGKTVPRVVLKNGEYVYEQPVDGEKPDPIEQNLPRVLVKKGARINSPGAPVLLAGPEVINEGDIRSDNGQIVLAGSRKDVYLALTTPQSTNLRGFIVEVDSGERADGYRGAVINAGTLTANLGNVTLVAGEIVQAGKIQSSTAVDVNGSVRLFARDRAGVLKSRNNVSAETALYLSAWETPEFAPVGTEAGDLLLTADSSIHIDIDRSIDLNKLVSKFNKAPSERRGAFFRLLGVGDSAEFSESVTQGIIDLDYAFDLAVNAGMLKPADRFEVVTTTTDSESRSTQISRTTGFLGDKSQPVSKIHIEGRHVLFADANESASGSRIVAPSADVSIRARNKPDALVGEFETPQTGWGTDASLVIGAGTLIDVSGTDDTILSVDRNTLTFFLTSNELRNSPQQKGGPLLRQTVTVDIREGTSLLDWTIGFGSVQKSANERSVTGGSIDLISSFLTQIGENVKLDVAGGKVTYAEGTLATTRLASTRGPVNIADADDNDIYTGVTENSPATLLDSKWGVMSAYRPGLSRLTRLRESYTEGFDAGFISIRSPNQKISDQSQWIANAQPGLHQQLSVSATVFQPRAGQIQISTNANPDVAGADVVIGNTADSGNALMLAPQLLQNSGAKIIRVSSEGAVVLDKANDLFFSAGTSLELTGSGVLVEGNIRSLGGDITLKQTQPTRDNSLAGSLLVAGEINTSGAWWNQVLEIPGSIPFIKSDAGNIELAANDQLFINETASFIANGGATLASSGRLEFGKAGDISIAAIQGSNLPAELIVEGLPHFEAIDAGAGGLFTLKVHNVDFGDSDTRLATDSFIGDDFFNNSLLNNFAFEALAGNITVGSTTDIYLSGRTLLARHDIANITSSDDIYSAASIWTPPDYLAPAIELSLAATRPGFTEQDIGILQIAEGAAIYANAGSSIQLSADTRMEVSGHLQAHGGQIVLELMDMTEQPDEATSANNYIYVTDTATLDVAAVAHHMPEDLATGEKDLRLFDAGNIEISAYYGHAIVAAEAQLLLQGSMADTRQLVYNSPGRSGQLQDFQVPLSAGSFSLAAEQSFNLQALVNFGDVDGGFTGGELYFTLDHGLKEKSSIELSGNKRQLDIVLTADQEANAIAELNFGDNLQQEWLGRGFITQKNLAGNHADRIVLDADNTVNRSGDKVFHFGSVLLMDNIDLEAGSALVLNTANLDLNNFRFDLKAPHVQLGESDSGISGTYALSLTKNVSEGSGQLIADADLLDFYGNLGISRAESLNLRAREGVRTRSVQYLDAVRNSRYVEDPILARNQLITKADMRLAAPVLFGETFSDYTFNLTGSNSLFEFGRYGTSDTPVISAFAKISVTGADQLYVDSRIATPFGAIDLIADKKLELGTHAELTVSGADLTLPLGRMAVDGLSWTYSTGGSSPTARLEFDSISGLGQMVENKSVRLSAPEVLAPAGSTIDLSGGGQFYAREFVQGLGGDVDVLAQLDYTQGFAILPSHSSGFAPFDYLEFFPAGVDRATIPWGTKLEVNGSAQVPDGSYTVLPASYALLPGAYIVTPENMDLLIKPGYRSNNTFGAEVVSGRVGTVGSPDADLWQTYRIESGSSVARRAEYRITQADDFAKFAGTAPGFRPEENGRLNLDVSKILDFSGSVKTYADSPVGVSLDISSGGRNIQVVEAVAENNITDDLQITQDLFASVGAESILLGGTRTWSDGSWLATPDAGVVHFADVELPATELLIVARDLISFTDTNIHAENSTEFAGNDWRLNANEGTLGSALLVAATEGSSLTVAEGIRQGQLAFDNASRVSASGILAVAYDGEVSLNALEFAVDNPLAKQLQLFTQNLRIGEAVEIAPRLLNQADQLVLDAREQIQFVGDLNLEAEQITLAAPQLYLAENSQARLAAIQTLTIKATGLTEAIEPAAGADSGLDFRADKVILAGGKESPHYLHLGAKEIAFNTNSLIAGGDMHLTASGDLTATTQVLAASGATQLQMIAQGDFVLTRNENGAASTNVPFSPAPIFRFEAGEDLTLDTQVQAQAGWLSLDAGENLALGANARVDLSPFIQQTPQGETKQSLAGAASLRSGANTTISQSSVFVFGQAESKVEGGELRLDVGGNLNWTLPAQLNFASGLDFELTALTVSAEQVADLSALNAAGFNGQFAVTLSEGDLDLGTADFTARDLSFIAGGVVSAAGQLKASDGQRNLTLWGRQGVRLADSARVELDSNNTNAAVEIAAPDGDMRIVSGAQVISSGDLRLILADDNFAQDTSLATQIASDHLQTEGFVEAYVAKSASLDDGLLSNTTLSQQISPLLNLIDSIWGPEQPAAIWSSLFAGDLPDRVMPYVTLTTPADLRVEDSAGFVDLAALRTELGLPGILDIRADGGIELRSGLSDGVDVLTLPSFSGLTESEIVSVLREDESWSFRIASGNNSSSPGSANITLRENTFIRTGTGDIQLNAGGNLVEQGNSYIGSFGQTQRKVDPAFVEFYGLDQPLPVFGNRDFFEYYLISPDFSGVSQNSGDVTLQVAGTIEGNTASWTAAGYMMRFATDDPVFSDLGFSYDTLSAHYLSLDLIKGGVHVVGGGNLSVDASGAINKMAFSTPGQFFVDSEDLTAAIDISGGKLQVKTGGNVTRSSFFGNKSDMALQSRAALGEGDDGLLFLGSDISLDLKSGRDLVIEAIVNNFVLPDYVAKRHSFLSADTTDIFFAGFDTSSVRAESVTGDVIFAPDAMDIAAYLPRQDFGTEGNSTLDMRYLVTPSQLDFSALNGDLVLQEDMLLFPDPSANLVFFAGQNIHAETALTEVMVTIPDIPASLLPSRANPVKRSEWIGSSVSVDLRPEQLLLNNLTRVQLGEPLPGLHGANFIDRSKTSESVITAARGSISADPFLVFRLPKAVQVYAGDSVINSAFEIQHNRLNDVSIIRAENQIRFPFTATYSGLNSFFGVQSGRYIRVDGPGDLIISAGGSIDLGNTDGIRSLGASENPALAQLSSQGANIHVLAGVTDLGDFQSLVGKSPVDPNQIPVLMTLFSDEQARLDASSADWFAAYGSALAEKLNRGGLANYSNDYTSIALLTSAVGQATGNAYFAEFKNPDLWNGFAETEQRAIATRALGRALADWQALSGESAELLRTRIAVAAMVDIALERPELFSSRGNLLFREPDLGRPGFASQEERSESFVNYWNGVGQLLALEYLLTPARVADLANTLNPADTALSGLSALSLSEQLALATNTFGQLDHSRQMLVAEHAMNSHMRQSSREGAAQGNSLVSFGRGYVAQRQFFGSDYDQAIADMYRKVEQIHSGEVTEIDAVNFGISDGATLASLDQVFSRWSADSGEDFTAAENPTARVADINSILTTIQTSEAGGSITLLAPRGSIDVGISQSQIANIGLTRTAGDLGVIAKGYGNVNAVVADAFNVNESRAFTLAGGAVNLWSAYGDVDAGKGAKTILDTPLPVIQVSSNSGRITVTRPPAVSGSGITSKESRSATGETLSPAERFYGLAEGAGPIFLSTPLGIVDAGEAGIQSAGDLFIAASKVVGADNISVGGASVGVVADTTVGGDVAAAGSSTNAATEAVQSSVTDKAASSVEENVTAFVTVEILDTGTTRQRRDNPANKQEEER